MARVGFERDLSIVDFLAGSGLEPGDLANPTGIISFEQEFRLIRNLLKHCGGATGLGLSVRTLRRRLGEEGASYFGLCDEVRGAIAERLLTGSRLQVEQIAETLGYSESASFIHAFKRWTGESPHAFRRARRPD